MDEEIALEREAVQDRRRARERADALSQKQKDLEDEKARAAKKSPESVTVSSQPSSVAPVPPCIDTTPVAHLTPDPTVDVSEPSDAEPCNEQSAAEADWQRQKDVEGASNDSIDTIMAMTGLENVKAQVLRIKAKIDLAQRQGASLKDERFNVVLLGNPGTGIVFLVIVLAFTSLSSLL